jgi:hypothetical protein
MISGRDEAISVLRREQQTARRRCGLAEPVNSDDMLAHTLQRAETRENTAERRNGKIRDGLFGYSETLEPVRWSRTRDIIQRVVPAANEDPVYLEIVARQAASIEIVLRQENAQTLNSRNNELCNHVLIGTIPTLDSSAYTSRTRDYFTILISVGLIDFLYQVTKAMVLSWQPVAPHKNASVGFDNSPETVRQVLASNPLPLAYFTHSLSGYLFRGQPHVIGYSPPPVEYKYPLQLHTNFNERFVLAHEYGHTLINMLDISHPDFFGPKEEFAADVFAFLILVDSGLVLDGMPPNVSLQSAFLVLTALQVLREALDLVRHGEIREDRGFVSHPPIAQRMETLQYLFQDKIDDGRVMNSITPLLRPAQTLSLLWHDAQPYFLRARAESQKLHAIWSDV